MKSDDGQGMQKFYCYWDSLRYPSSGCLEIEAATGVEAIIKANQIMEEKAKLDQGPQMGEFVWEYVGTRELP